MRAQHPEYNPPNSNIHTHRATHTIPKHNKTHGIASQRTNCCYISKQQLKKNTSYATKQKTLGKISRRNKMLTLCDLEK